MNHDVRRLPLAAVLGAAVLALGACGSSSKSSSTSSTTSVSASSAGATTAAASAPVAVVGKTTTVTVNPETAALLKQNDITMTAVAPAKASTVLVFPVTGGHISVTTFAGAIDESGGITLAHAGRTVTLTNFVVDTETRTITASVSGQTVPVFDLNLASLARASGVGGTLVASNIKLLVTGEAASELNSLLGVTALKAGQEFGIATVALTIK